MLVGRARARYGIHAPATTGHEIFERYFRVHANTMEQLVVFLPAAFAFAHFVSDVGAAILGLAFVAGRGEYLRRYVADPTSRGPAVLLSVLPTWVLVIGALLGALFAAFG